MSRTKINPADRAFSLCVRTSKNWTCERCGKAHENGSTGLHCSHIFSRRHRTIRWCKENAQALCFACHSWYGGNPIDSGLWVERFVGIGVIEILREKMNKKNKITKLEEKEIVKHYRDQLKKMENGDDFDSWQ